MLTYFFLLTFYMKRPIIGFSKLACTISICEEMWAHPHFSKFVSGGIISINKTCVFSYRKDITLSEVSLVFCVLKCKQDELCEYATWKKTTGSSHLGQCYLSTTNCNKQQIVDEHLYKFWQKRSKFPKFSYLTKSHCRNVKWIWAKNQ